MAAIEPEAAFVDVASGEHWVCIPEDRCEHNVRRFGAFTGDLHALRDWLVEHGIRVVGMESTGVYWINLYQILEDAGMEVGVVNARDLKYVKGRPKTDKLDCQWGQRLLCCGLLRSSFRPSGEICQMRAIWAHARAAREGRFTQFAAHAQGPLRNEPFAAQGGIGHWGKNRHGHH